MSDLPPKPSQAEAHQKSEIIEALFDARWDAASKTLKNPVVVLKDVQAAIQANNESKKPKKPLSAKNPANFIKDVIRNVDTSNRIWPKAVFEAGYTAIQRTGGSRCFEFVPVKPGQKSAFARLPEPTPDTPIHRIQSVSIPLASRRLGRSDEPWLVQVLVRLKVIETHLALESDSKIVQLDHLQTNVKLSEAEIDALFLATEELPDKGQRELLVTCEAKGLTDDVIESQVLNQISVASQLPIAKYAVIPIAVKAIGSSRVLLYEFETVLTKEAKDKRTLDIAKTAIYEFFPPVQGIGARSKGKVKGASLA